MPGFGHVKYERPIYKKTLSKAMNATLTDDESTSDNQSENFNPDEEGNYMAFT